MKPAPSIASIHLSVEGLSLWETAMHLIPGWAYLAAVRSDRNVFSATNVIDQLQPLNLAWTTTGFSTRALPSKRQRVTKDC
jgi:hypothetical protein